MPQGPLTASYHTIAIKPIRKKGPLSDTTGGGGYEPWRENPHLGAKRKCCTILIAQIAVVIVMVA
jgi:hypothetical protein